MDDLRAEVADLKRQLAEVTELAERLRLALDEAEAENGRLLRDLHAQNSIERKVDAIAEAVAKIAAHRAIADPFGPGGWI